MSINASPASRVHKSRFGPDSGHTSQNPHFLFCKMRERIFVVKDYYNILR